MTLTGRLTCCGLLLAGALSGCGLNNPSTTPPTAVVKQESSTETAETSRGIPETATTTTTDLPDDSADDPPTGDSQAGQHRFALLVGCTRYYHKGEHPWRNLKGPGNDVLLMRRLLVKRYHFPKSHVTILSEAQGGDNTPTRKHIQREFLRLAEKARRAGPKGQFVILLAGHGSWQPDNNGDEFDGRDETFLPADIGRWNEATHTVANAIVDDELQKWTEAITTHGTPLWVIVDACHSGTVLRGGGEDEVSRRVSPSDLGVPAEALSAAKKRAAANRATRGASPAEQGGFEMSGAAPRLAAIYAASPRQSTPERRPYGSDDYTYYGLLTYTLCEVLNTARTPMTYRELVARINRQYIHWGRRLGPTPLVEGKLQDRLVLGSTERPPAFTLQPDFPKGWEIDGGRLHGLTPGSIMAVYPPPGAANADKPVGHVKITRTDLYTSHVEPTAFKTFAKPQQGALKQGGRCEPAFIDYGPMRTTVAIDRHIMDRQGSHPPERDQKAQLDRLTKQIARLARLPGAVFRIARSPAQAQWVIQIRDGRLVLIAAGTAPILSPLPDGTPAFPLPDKGTAEELTSDLRRIAQAQNLIALSTAPVGEVARSIKVRSTASVEVILLKQRDNADHQGRPLSGDDIKLKHEDGIAWRVTNKGRDPIDVTLLFIDSRFGIESVFPRPGRGSDNRLMPGKSLRIPLPGGGLLKDGFVHVDAERTTGREHVVTIAVVANGPAIDFSGLKQPTLAAARGLQTRGDGPRPFETPLGRLLRRACYGGGTRGQDVGVVKTYQMHLLSWRVLPIKTHTGK